VYGWNIHSESYTTLSDSNWKKYMPFTSYGLLVFFGNGVAWALETTGAHKNHELSKIGFAVKVAGYVPRWDVVLLTKR
jgi:hypothetical protein